VRFLVLSDTHGDKTGMVRALDYLDALKADALLHLGDFDADADFLGRELRLPVTAVSGNCDAFRSMRPTEEILEVEGLRLLLTHGHRYGVKENLQRLLYAALERDCAAALFGHTHEPHLSREEGVLLLNPGSLCQPRLGNQAGLALLTVEKGEAKAVLLPYALRR
jgi:putative phosphoesterase